MIDFRGDTRTTMSDAVLRMTHFDYRESWHWPNLMFIAIAVRLLVEDDCDLDKAFETILYLCTMMFPRLDTSS